MTTRSQRVLRALCILCLAAAGTGRAAPYEAKPMGEPKAAVAGEAPLEIRQLEGMGPRARVRTPQYQTDIGTGRVPPREWARVLVTFDTFPDWIDELTFQFYVLTVQQVKGKKDYSLFKGSVVHTDVVRGRGHQTVMFMRPTTLERYGEVIGVAVEVLNKGEIVKVMQKATQIPKEEKEWWKNPNLSIRDGYLVNLSQTPFAFINYDDYEPPK